MVGVQVFHVWASSTLQWVCIEGRVESDSLSCSGCHLRIVSPSWFVRAWRHGCKCEDYHLHCLPVDLKQERAQVALDGCNLPLVG